MNNFDCYVKPYQYIDNVSYAADMEEADWDSGEYEDVDKDEMESFGRGRFRSESEVQGEKDMDSNRSYNYDDIDEVTEAQPLTPQGSMVRATEDEDMHEGNVKPSDGKRTTTTLMPTLRTLKPQQKSTTAPNLHLKEMQQHLKTRSRKIKTALCRVKYGEPELGENVNQTKLCTKKLDNPKIWL
ncbi:hypothetical protein XENOCAPTIV_016192 [Xenoophorus captivus]|uniref:Uncharacterized protein n=1 Tax=Xenoophorus captivus TaxID=1517983 RepID=A0ABV0R3U9_9TELE